MTSIVLDINGTRTTLTEEGSLPLLLALRNVLGLKGVRFGCGGEDCGSCMVLVGNEPRYSCTTAIDAIDGQAITTVEGLTDETAQTLREAFLAERAGQCGYCLSGIFVTAYSLLRGSRQLTKSDIATGLSRHLCRCGSHPSILRAVERAASRLRLARSHE